MLNLHLVAVGERMPRWVSDGFAEYQRRIRGRMSLNLIEVPIVKRGKRSDLARVRAEEERRLMGAVPANCQRVALDRQGIPLPTHQLVARLEDWLGTGEQAALIVGGPDGLSDTFRRQVGECWSLSALTMAHPVVRVVVAEQIYRCWSILEGHPYHR